MAAWKVTVETGRPEKEVGVRLAASEIRRPKANAIMDRATMDQSVGVVAELARDDRRETGHQTRKVGVERKRSAAVESFQ